VAHQENVRRARVVAVGPGHYGPLGTWHPTTLLEGEVVLVDRLAGQPYDWDLNIPRQNKKGCEWSDDELSFRAVREAECLAVVDDDRGSPAVIDE